MKKILLSIFTCGIYFSIFAQPGISNNPKHADVEKWEIIKLKSKSSAGKLIVTLPGGTEWDMTIHPSGSGKVLFNTMLKTSIGLTDGIYDIEINHIWIKGVPIEKGSTTRLKAGVLEITTPGPWTLYNETKDTVLINTYYPQKRGLPIGKYVLSANGQSRDIIIHDDPLNVVSLEVPENDYYDITPLDAMAAGMGKLSIKIPKDTTIFIVDKWVTLPLLIRDTVKIREGNEYHIIDLPKYLTASSRQINLSQVGLSIPIKSGQETRIKAGFLIITKKEDPEGNTLFDHLVGQFDGANWEWKLQNLYQGNIWHTIAHGEKRTIIALPPGEYRLIKLDPHDAGPGGDDIKYKVIIKDGEWVKNGIKQ